MVDAAWPATVPDEPDAGSYTEQYVSNLSAFQPDAGPPTTLRRSTIKSSKIQCSFFMTPAELEDFRAFFEDDLGDGSLPFTWTNPVYGVSKRYLFAPDSPPQWAPIGVGSAYRVSCTIVKLS
jgi:hypothetical protein